MNLLNELLNTQAQRIEEIKLMQKFALVNSLGEMVNPTDYGYEVGFFAEWTWTLDELDNAVDVSCWMSEKWNNEIYVVPCANVDEKIWG